MRIAPLPDTRERGPKSVGVRGGQLVVVVVVVVLLLLLVVLVVLIKVALLPPPLFPLLPLALAPLPLRLLFEFVLHGMGTL